ncbi:YozE family protein [Ectobacillus sp. sgz5001026]|uniref:YozE family protein n=1 Tax=Ectobacillus sp. sgz5001026 TaxID=3242473 RepID=UPI0036D34034
MSKSFYHYMMKYRHSTKADLYAIIATVIYEDHSFPKYSNDYEEISSYLEVSGLLDSMTMFDQAWETYLLETALHS